MSGSSFARLFSGVALVNPGELHRLSGDLLDTLGELFHLGTIPFVSRRDAQGQQVAEGIDGDVNLGTALTLGAIVPEGVRSTV